MHKPHLHTAVFGHLIEETLLYELIDSVPPEDKDAALSAVVSLVTLTCIQKAYNSLEDPQLKTAFTADITALLSRSIDLGEFYARYPGSEQIMQEQAQRTLLSLHTKKK